MPGKCHGQRSLEGYIAHGVTKQQENLKLLRREIHCEEPLKWGGVKKSNREREQVFTKLKD